MNEMHFLKNLSTPDQYAIADTISEFSNGWYEENPGGVKPVTPTELLEKQHTLVMLQDEKLAGTISADMPTQHNGKLMTKIGTLWVPDTYKRKGHAHQLVTAMTTFAILACQQPYARVNNKSKWAFQTAGFTPADSPLDIPTPDRFPNPEIHGNRISQVLILGENVMSQIKSEMLASSQQY